MIATEETFKIYDGTTISYKWYGCHPSNDNIKRIIGLHGWLDNANTFDPILSHIIKPNVCFISMDFTGHGLSGRRPTGCHYLLIDRAIEVYSLFIHLGWVNPHKPDSYKKASIIAHSYGQAVSLIFACTFPYLISRMICYDSFGPYINPKDTLPMRLRRVMTDISKDKYNTYISRQYATSEQAIDQYYNNRKSDQIKRKSVEILAKRGLKEVKTISTKKHPNVENREKSYIWGHDPRCLGTTVMIYDEETLLTFLKQLDCPVLVILSDITRRRIVENDDIFIKMRNRINVIKDITTTLVSGGHHVHMDSAEIVGKLTCEFIINEHYISNSMVLDNSILKSKL